MKNNAWKCSVFCTRIFTFVSRFGLHFGSIFELRRQLWSRPNRFFSGNASKGVSKGPFALILAPKVLSKRPLGSILAPSVLLLVMFGKVWGRFLEGFGAQPSAQKYAVRSTLYADRWTLHAVRCTPYSAMNYSWRSQRVQVRCTLCAVRCRLYAVRCTLHTVPCTLYAVGCTLYSVQRTWTRRDLQL